MTKRELLYISGTVAESERRRSRICLAVMSFARSRTQTYSLNTAIGRRVEQIVIARYPERSDVALSIRVCSLVCPNTLAPADPPGVRASSTWKFVIDVSHRSGGGAEQAGLVAVTLGQLHMSTSTHTDLIEMGRRPTAFTSTLLLLFLVTWQLLFSRALFCRTHSVFGLPVLIKTFVQHLLW